MQLMENMTISVILDKILNAIRFINVQDIRLFCNLILILSTLLYSNLHKPKEGKSLSNGFPVTFYDQFVRVVTPS